ncbi:CheY-like chemotaxis protein [Brevundimonas nasdae]|jgi:CheY-like chemotaxis protein|uniref:response regulator n=1 Tax=Brevundimonas TaxID=41275 RepID=UPI0002A438EE|nr:MULTISPECIES: response regulator [Brevundimonas]EKY27582.1 response regulator receiver domain protein [Brevundimonas diminuta 470-4]MBK6025842.1 response regulator [Brevundimonas nasdae]MDQ0452302.1 CheY-like chemotaxis protein [Brevundimonas nasdae]NSX33737.1 response regulator [Brevundimonas vesicularis]
MVALITPQQVILVVDDEALLRLDATEAFHHIGCQTYEAAETEEALDILERHPEISVLFTDINMPGPRDGMALASQVHRQRPDVQLIVTSGRERPAPEDLPERGHFIAKPYTMEAVADLVRAFPKRTAVG